MSGVQIPHARLINTKTMEIYTVQEFQERWDEMIERVEHGENIGISDGKNTCVMVSADEELIRIYTDHEEGC